MLYNLFYGALKLRKLCVSNTETDTVAAKCCQVNSTICDKPFLEEMDENRDDGRVRKAVSRAKFRTKYRSTETIELCCLNVT
jgi:hypothetical protein